MRIENLMLQTKMDVWNFGYNRKDGRFYCTHRAPKPLGGLGLSNCHCARHDDGSCVQKVKVVAGISADDALAIEDGKRRELAKR
jgi:hypothetical protein